MHHLSADANKNYVATIVKIDNLRKHQNADRLQITTIDGANIIVGLDVVLGDVMVFCPTESCLNSDFLKVNNLFDSASLNADSEKRGYINNKGRIRAIKLRGESSRACLLSLQTLQNWKPDIDISEFHVGEDFDTVCGETFIVKYVPPSKGSSLARTGQKKVSKATMIVDNQFHFHIDTAQLARNLSAVSPNDTIQLSHKLHGHQVLPPT